MTQLGLHSWAKVSQLMVQGRPGGYEDQARTPVAARGGMVKSNTWRGFGIRGGHEGEKWKASPSLPACGATNREKDVAGFHLFFIFLSAMEFILRTCPYCSDLSKRAVFQYKDNSTFKKRKKEGRNIIWSQIHLPVYV